MGPTPGRATSRTIWRSLTRSRSTPTWTSRNNYGANEPLVGGGVLQPEAHVQPGVGRVARPVHDVGLPLVFAPLVRVAVPLTNALTRIIPEATMRRARLNPPVLYRQLLSLAMIALAAVLAGLMFDALVALGASARAAFGTTALLMLSPPLLIFSVLFFTELLSALLCFVVFSRIRLRDTRGAAQWWWLGCLTGFLFLLHARNIGLTIPLTALALHGLRDPARRREAGAFALGVSALVAVRTGINYLFWGTLLSNPHARLGGWPGWAALAGETTTRTIGLLVDQEFGLLIYAPVYAVALWGARALMKTRRDVALSVFVTAGLYVALIICPLTNVHGWTGGWNPAARFLTPIVPLLGLFVFAGLRAAPQATRGRRRDAADRHQRVRVAAPQDPVERRRRPRGVLRTARRPRVRLSAVADQTVATSIERCRRTTA